MEENYFWYIKVQIGSKVSQANMVCYHKVILGHCTQYEVILGHCTQFKIAEKHGYTGLSLGGDLGEKVSLILLTSP